MRLLSITLFVAFAVSTSYGNLYDAVSDAVKYFSSDASDPKASESLNPIEVDSGREDPPKIHDDLPQKNPIEEPHEITESSDNESTGPEPRTVTDRSRERTKKPIGRKPKGIRFKRSKLISKKPVSHDLRPNRNGVRSPSSKQKPRYKPHLPDSNAEEDEVNELESQNPTDGGAGSENEDPLKTVHVGSPHKNGPEEQHEIKKKFP